MLAQKASEFILKSYKMAICFIEVGPLYYLLLLWQGRHHGVQSVQFAPYQIFLNKCISTAVRINIFQVSKIYLKSKYREKGISFREFKCSWLVLVNYLPFARSNVVLLLTDSNICKYLEIPIFTFLVCSSTPIKLFNWRVFLWIL